MSFHGLDGAVRSGSAALVRRILWTAFLATIVSGERPLRAVHHPLGFVCLPVLRDADEGICVHVWPDTTSDRLATSNVHCHSWHLRSFVLEGTVHNQTFDLVDTADGPLRVFVVNSAGGVDNIVSTDRLVDLKAAEPMSYHAGESYEMDAGIFHASPRLGSGTAVTVILGRQCPGAENLTLADRDARIRSSVRELFSAEETREIIRRVFPEYAA
jgi:hypothetical protein